ncbi:MAG: hypothetical protein Q8O76_04720, partial [Chloroflexota bacterium]|nr:hypothetical protein [Chloroflexota bacterium]
MTTTPSEHLVGGPGGRAPRTGIFIRAYLIQNNTGYPAEIHRAYVEFFRARHVPTRKGRTFRLSTYQSFLYYFHRCRLLGLVAFARQEPTPGWDRAEGRGWRGSQAAAARRFYRLTTKGRAQDEPWVNPNRIYQSAPPGGPAAPRSKAPLPVQPPPPVPKLRFEVPATGGRRAAQDLIKHLLQLEKLPQDTPEMLDEFERLGTAVGTWLETTQEGLSTEEDKENPNEERLEKL